MKVALTGATGFIGSHILTELHEHGHEVTALVRDDDQARARRGPRRDPGRGRPLRPPRGRGPAARGGRRPSTRPVPATRPAQTWTPRWPMQRSRRSPAPASPTSTSAACGSTATTPSISEESPFNPPALVAWKEPIERRVLDADGHARSRDRVRRRLRRRRRRGSRAASRLTPGRRRQPDHARHGTAALVDRPRRGPRESSSAACWRTTRLAAATSSATDRTRPSPN